MPPPSEQGRTSSETSLYFKETTWRYIPEGFNIRTRRRENLISLYKEETTWET
jgi:hypothetical protein